MATALIIVGALLLILGAGLLHIAFGIIIAGALVFGFGLDMTRDITVKQLQHEAEQ